MDIKKIFIILFWVYFISWNVVFAESDSLKILKANPLFSMAQRGEYVPISFLNKKFIYADPEIWQNDASLKRFVSTTEPLSSIQFAPKELVSMSGTYINQAGRSSQIRADVKPHLDELGKAFSEYFHEPLVAISGYRSAEYQQRLWDL